MSTWGGTSPQFTQAVGDLEPTKIIPDIETVMNLAQSSPSIARWNAELGRGEAALALARSERVPNVTVGVGTRREQDATDTDYLLDVEIDIPIFDRNQGEIRAARYELARVQARRMAAEAAASEAIAEVYYALTESQARSSTMKNEVLPATRAAFDAYRQVFEKSGTNLDDVLDARRDLARGEVDLTDALVDYRRKLAELEGLVGNDLAVSN